MRELDEDFYDEWSKKFQESSESHNRKEEVTDYSKLSHKYPQLEKLAVEIEKDLMLLGATAIEDKLQDQVPEALADLRKVNENF